MAEPEAGSASTVTSAHKEVFDYCKPFKEKYNRCFNEWYQKGFLKGNLSTTCDDHFEDYKACVLEEMAARKLPFPGLDLQRQQR
mmetsp:Transcript_73359/g.159085  ORF Transcript_73359/g.159085 Transcript_73359/m.159085 type:complete len:84 (-) Transcript_73359:90-341(-)